MSKYSDEISKVPPESFAERWPVIAPEMLTKREQFTMAAMRGLLSGLGRTHLSNDEIYDIVNTAVFVANEQLDKLERTK